MSPAIIRPLAIEGDLQSFYVYEAGYVLTLSNTCIDVWRATGEHGHLDHVTRLDHFVRRPRSCDVDPIIDTFHNIVVIPDLGQQDDPPLLWVFNLTDGKLIRKVDFFILSFCCLMYFFNYLDRSNLTQAYVSGMKEDLDFQGNQLTQITTVFTCGYIV